MRVILFLVISILLTGCAATPTKTSQLLFRDADDSGHYSRLYTSVARLAVSRHFGASSHYLVFLADRDEQGFLLMSATNVVQSYSQAELELDGQRHTILPREKFAQQTVSTQKQGLMFHLPMSLLQKMAGASDVTLHLDGVMAIPLEAALRDRLSLLLVAAEFAENNQQWSDIDSALIGDGSHWLKRVALNDTLAPAMQWNNHDPGRYSRIGDSNLYLSPSY